MEEARKRRREDQNDSDRPSKKPRLNDEQKHTPSHRLFQESSPMNLEEDIHEEENISKEEDIPEEEQKLTTEQAIPFLLIALIQEIRTHNELLMLELKRKESEEEALQQKINQENAKDKKRFEEICYSMYM